MDDFQGKTDLAKRFLKHFQSKSIVKIYVDYCPKLQLIYKWINGFFFHFILLWRLRNETWIYGTEEIKWKYTWKNEMYIICWQSLLGLLLQLSTEIEIDSNDRYPLSNLFCVQRSRFNCANSKVRTTCWAYFWRSKEYSQHLWINGNMRLTSSDS